MSTPPFAQVQISTDGGATWVSGGITVALNATVRFRGANTAGWNTQLWEIYDFPSGFATPAGWTLTAGGVLQSTAVTPPNVGPVATWGKYGIRLTVNGGLDPTGVFNPAGANGLGPMIDEATAISILSPKGLRDLFSGEKAQYGGTLKQWLADLQATLRSIDTQLGGGGSVPTGTGFPHITSGVQDAAARAVNLASADVTGVLAAANLPNATTGALGIVQLAQDLGGTATAPTVVSATGAGGLFAISAAASSIGSTAATAGSGLRIANGSGITVRNPGNTANRQLVLANVSDGAQFGDSAFTATVSVVSGSHLTLDCTSNVNANVNINSGNGQAIVGGGKVYLTSTLPLLQFALNTTAPKIAQEDTTTASATGQPLRLAAQNATGTTSTGGDLEWAPGTGTTANGKINLVNGTTATSATGGAATAPPALPVGYLVWKLAGTVIKLPYYAN